jgi:hypothetical protein
LLRTELREVVFRGVVAHSNVSASLTDKRIVRLSRLEPWVSLSNSPYADFPFWGFAI